MLDKYNLTMLTDFYELTMANGYFRSEVRDYEACFDMFFRKVPDHGGYAIMAGHEEVIEYLKRRISRICTQKGFLAKNFWIISRISNSPATYGQFPRALRYSLTNRYSQSPDR